MTETASAPAGNTPATPVLDEFGQQAKSRLVSVITEYNGLATQFKAQQGTEQELLEALRETHTDNGGPIDKLNEQREKLYKAFEEATAKRDALLQPVVEQMIASRTNEGADALTDKMAALLKTINSGKNYLTGIYGDAAIADLPTVQRKTGAGSASTGQGSGKRVRGFDFFVDGTLAKQKDSQGNDRSNLSAAAKQAKVDVKAMQAAFFTAQGTQEAKDYKDQVSFTITGKDENGADKAYEVMAKRAAEDAEPTTETASPPAA